MRVLADDRKESMKRKIINETTFQQQSISKTVSILICNKCHLSFTSFKGLRTHQNTNYECNQYLKSKTVLIEN